MYSFENVPANQFHNSDYRKSSYSKLTTHRSLKEKGKINEINQSTRTSRRGPKLIFQVQEIDLKLLATNLNCYELQGLLFSSFFGQPCTEYVITNLLMLLAVRISSYGSMHLGSLESNSHAFLSCSPNFPRVPITRYTYANHEQIFIFAS